MKSKLAKLAAVLLPYRFRIICTFAGLLGGIGGIVLGFLSGFFIDLLILRTNDEKKLQTLFEQSALKNSLIEEPFEGALQICSLSVYLTGNPSFAAKQIRAAFPLFAHIDWETLCRAAFSASIPNIDLVTECLASKLSKCSDTGLLSNVFGLLEAVEFGWDDRNGNKPSAYLSELLQVSCKKTNRASAYRILGVNETDALSVIKSAHRRLISQYHPDTLKSLSPEQQSIALDAFHRIQKAYEVILELRNIS